MAGQSLGYFVYRNVQKLKIPILPYPMDKISETILKFLRLDNFVQNLTGYVEARIELLKVEIREDVAKAIARGMGIVALFFIGFLFLFFFSVGLAQFLNRLFDGPYAGYFSLAGIYGA